jgi:alpha-tubulin suppressor-like RCC1 family protein
VGASTTFEVTFTAGAEFNRSAVLHVASNDPGTGVFNINLTGIGSGLLAATYSTGAEVPLTSGNFTATGSNVNFALNHAPAAGTQLTVVSNTGLGFIKGTFDNLAQGQMVTMNYGGVAYKFVANYYGGSGNDLVLQWAPTRPVAWGNNSSGQLGNASLTNNYVPAAVSTAGVLADRVVVALACGSSHSLALCADGTLAAWGNNSYGQLGTGNTSTSNVPVAVDRTGALSNKTVVAVAAGDSYSLALCSDGTLAAWGYNNYGQLGIGNTTNSNLPVAVNTTGALAGKTVIAVAAGDSHVLALCSDGTLGAWGYNGNGQLGNGNTSQSNVPVAVSTSGVLSGKTVAAVAAGDSHSLALCSDGTLAAWGYNSSGQLGNGHTTSSSLPLAVDRTGVLAGKTLAAVAAGGSHSLAWCTDGTLTAWGSNNWGQLTNNGTTSSTSYVPVVVSPAGGLAGKSIVTTAAGNSHTLALCSDGTLTAWGYNNIGQLGNGTATDSSVPVTVSRANLALGEKFVAANSNQSASHNLGIVALPLISRIVVEQPAGSGLVSGRGTLDFGIVPTGTVVSKTFTIRNNGIVPLVINSVTLDGVSATEFALTNPPAASVAAGGNTTFVVTFTAGPRFTRSAVVHIASNDPYTGVFDVNLTATVPGVLAASYNTGLEVPLICNGFTATGSSVNFSLNFAPATGTRLTVVRNTGPGFINGTFDNLAQGQVVTLNYAGGTYRFVANYYGGSGNDLVLEWGATRPVGWGYNGSGQLGNGSTTSSSVPAAVSATGILTDKTIIAVAMGGSHSLARCSDGTLAAWGSNNSGQLGNGTTTDSTAPVAVSAVGALAGKTVVAVVAGESHSLALCSDGTLAAWGYNPYGQLGNGSGTNSKVPVAVDRSGVLAGKSVVAVTAGGNHSLALCSDGTLATWGMNLYGQLGNGSTSSSSVPVAVNTGGVLSGKAVIAVAAGSSYCLALCSDGTLAAWGYNTYGQLGNGTTTNSSVPVAVNTTGVLSDKTVVAMAAGNSHCLVLCSDGTLAAWGYNNSGQLGDGTTTSSTMPLAVNMTAALSSKTVIAVAAGSNHSLARCSDGTLAAWGYNYYGQLGNGRTTDSNVPVVVSESTLAAGEKLVAATSGQSALHSLGIVAVPFAPRIVVQQPAGNGLTNGRSAVDFGSGAVGAGVPRTFVIKNNGNLPLTIDSVTIDGTNAAEFSLTIMPAASVEPGGSTTLVVTFTAGAPFTRSAALHIANNDLSSGIFHVNLTATGSGVLAATYSTGSEIPLTTSGVFTATGSSVNFTLNHAPVTGTQLMVVKNTGLGFITGTFDNLAHGQIVTLDYGGVSYNFVANYYGGSGNDLVLQWAATRPLAWGQNDYGQLGNGSTATGYLPAEVSKAGALSGKTVAAMTAGGAHGLALCTDGTLAAWGYNGYGRLGNGSTTPSTVPVAVSMTGVLSGKTVITVAAGYAHSLALCSDGTLVAWGYNGNGQLGNGSTTNSNAPVVVNTAGVLLGKTVVAVAAGSGHSLALCSDGTLAAWGSNGNGQMGIGSTTSSNVPVAVNAAGVLAGKTVVAVAAGGSHSLALCSDGTLASWGYNNNGQLGNGSTTDNNLPAVVDQTGVLAGKTVVAVAAGDSHNFALCSDGTLAAWGYNSNGQLGNGNTTQNNLPAAVDQTGLLAGKRVVTIAAGYYHSLALCTDGTLVAWGSNSYGRLGNGSTASSNVPVAVSRATLTAGEQYVAGMSGLNADFNLGLVAVPPPAQIVVEQPAGTALISANSTVDFGTVSFKGSATSLTFTLRNDRGGPFTASSVTFNGDNGADFSLSKPPVPVAAGSSTTFVVAFAPGAAGVRNAAMHVAGNALAGSFDVNLTGIGGTDSTLAVNYTTGLEVPLMSDGFTATGVTVGFTLNHVPDPGTQLTVVRNTGLGFIRGTFDNLSQGQLVPLTYAGNTYNFVANYYGGSGNDLVLQWAAARAFAWGSNTYGQLGNNTTANSQVPFEVRTAGILAGKTVIAVAAGDGHSLALCADGTLAAWGNNANGQLGNGSTIQSKVPVAVNTAGVLAGKTVVAVAAGISHSLALCADGTLAAWGSNGNGRLGNGTTTDSTVPVAVNMAGVLSGKAVIAVKAGDSQSVALCTDGTLAAWGYNGNGQLGNGNTISSNVPVAVCQVADMSGRRIVAVALGTNHSLACCADGTLFAWGYNYNGQLGAGTTTDSMVSVAVGRTGLLAGKPVVAVSAGFNHSLALCADGTLAAWGYNSQGQLGNGSTTQVNVPTAVDQTGLLAGKTIVNVAAGYSHSMVLCADGSLAAWGYNTSGQLGNAGTTNSPVPVAVNMTRAVPGGRFVAGASDQGAYHSLAIIAEPSAPRIALEQPVGSDLTNGISTVDFGGSVPGTGVSRAFTIRNYGSIDLTDMVVSFDGAHGGDFAVATPPAAAVAPGASTTFTVTFTPGSIGARYGVMHITSNDPLPGDFAVNLAGTSIGTLEATYSSGLEVPLTTGSFTATGNTVNIVLNHAPLVGTTLMVVRNTGVDFIQGAFGNLAQGQIVPLTFAGITYNFVANYYGGSGNDLVLQWAATRLLAWGANGSGRLGNNSFSQSNLPTLVNEEGCLAGKTVIATAAGAGHSVALCADGTLAAWGDNLYGQLGNNSTTNSRVPIPVDLTGALAGKTVIAIAAGRYHNLALCTDGTVAAWGRGLEGQLGIISPTNSLVPVAVSKAADSALAGKKVVAVAAGAYHSLALCSDGTLASWGYNEVGQLGNNAPWYVCNLPVAVNVQSGVSALYGKKVTAVAAGDAHTLALCSDGTLAAWGDNSYDQFGTFYPSLIGAPVAVSMTTGVFAGKTVIAVAAGANHNLALCSDGTVVAWGDGYYGQLGDNATSPFGNGPVAVNTTPGLSALAGRSVVAISAGNRHSMARCADGTLVSWGYNYYGQLGDNTTTQRKVPVTVSSATLPVGGSWVVGTSSQSAYHSLAIAADRVAPGIAVECPATVGLMDGTSVVDFGSVASGGNTHRTFTLRNPGNATLHSLFIATDGPNEDEFTVGPPGTTTLAPGASTLFEVTFSPTGLFARTATIHIVSNVTGAANPFDIDVIGTGLTQIEQWRLTYFQTTDNSGNAADTATPQNDGISNLMKFATGMNPTHPGTIPYNFFNSADNLVFKYSRSKAAVIDGISFTVEWSDTLTSDSWNHSEVSEKDSDQGNTCLVTATLPAGPGPARFVRLRVGRP